MSVFIRASGESRLSVVDQFPISVYQAQDMSQVLCNNLTRCEPTLWIFRRVKSLIVDPVEESMLLISECNFSRSCPSSSEHAEPSRSRGQRWPPPYESIRALIDLIRVCNSTTRSGSGRVL